MVNLKKLNTRIEHMSNCNDTKCGSIVSPNIWNVYQGSISPTFYARIFCQYPFAKKSQSRSVIREKLQNLLLYKKRARKMLVKLTTVLHKIASKFTLINYTLVLYVNQKFIELSDVRSRGDGLVQLKTDGGSNPTFILSNLGCRNPTCFFENFDKWQVDKMDVKV